MRQSKKQKQLREFIDKTNADEGAEVLRRDSGREKVYDDNVNNKSVDNGGESGIMEMRGEISSNSINWLPKGDTISFEEYKNIREYANQNGISLQGFKTSDVDVQLVKETIDSAKQVTDVFPELLGNSKRPLLKIYQSILETSKMVLK